MDGDTWPWVNGVHLEGGNRREREGGKLTDKCVILLSRNGVGYRIHGLISAYAYFQNCKEICAYMRLIMN